MCRVNDSLILVKAGQTNSILVQLDWQSWQLQRRQQLEHLTAEESTPNDSIVGHRACPNIDALHHCPGYLIVAENFGDIQFIPLASPSISSSTLRLNRRWTGYTGIVSGDLNLEFLIVETTDQFMQF